MLKFTKKVLNIRKADIYLYHQNKTKFNFLLIMETIAKKICQYNGQTGTKKQIEKCIKNFHFSIQLVQQFAKNRINL